MKLFFKQKSVFKEEREIASEYFDLVDHRVALWDAYVGHPQPVVSKYSVTQDYAEYVKDLKALGMRPINGVQQHNWSSKISEWYWDLERYTPKTWFNPFSNPQLMSELKKHGGPFFVRYDTKSKRELWKTHCYAETYDDLVKTSIRLSEDYKYENETVAVREYVQLQAFSNSGSFSRGDGTNQGASHNSGVFTSLGGQPIVKEFRVHRAYGTELCRHFYWEPFQEDIELQHGVLDPFSIPSTWLKEITDIADGFSNFYVVDVAQTASGEWILIEVNEGQHAGVHTDHLKTYYKNLHDVVVCKV